MKRGTVLLGAGATVEIGGIVSKDLTKKVIDKKQEYIDQQDKAVKVCFLKKVADTLNFYLKKECNFEDVFNALEILSSLRIGSFGRIETPWGAFLKSKNEFENIDNKLLIEAHSNLLDIVADSINQYNSEFKDGDYDFFRDFWKEMNTKCPVNIINLNYDTCLEQTFGEGNFIDGFDIEENVTGIGSDIAYKFSIKQWNCDTVLPKILHLHGCINYGMATIKGDCNKYAFKDDSYDMYKYSSYEFAKEHWIGHTDMPTQSGEIIFTDPIITGLRKTDKILIYPFSYYFYEFEKSIYENNCFLIAGYSFNDLYLNEILMRIPSIHDDNYKVVIITYVDGKASEDSFSQGAYDVISHLIDNELAEVIHDGLPECYVSNNRNVLLYSCGLKRAIKTYKNKIIDFLG